MKISVIYISIIISGVISLIILFCHIPNIERPFEIIEVDTSKCLDGTNYKFLFSKGTLKDKFLLFFEGGGLCGFDNDDPLKDCENRAKGEFGSSNYASILIKYVFSKYSRIFSSKVDYNPLYHDWNKVFIRYCDGMIHTGNTEIITPRKVKLYFQGERNVIDTINYLKKNHDFANAKEVVITGSSAGGMAATFWGNYIKGQTDKAQHYLINDSGFQIDYIDKERTQFKAVVEKLIQNTNVKEYYSKSELFKTYCEEHIESFWKCYFPEYILPKVNLPYLLLHSQYDVWMESRLAGVKCIVNSTKMINSCNDNEKQKLERYSESFNIIIEKLRKGKTDVSIWLPRSLTHTFFIFSDAWDNKVWKVGENEGNKVGLYQVLTEWMDIVKNNKLPLQYVDKTNEKMQDHLLKDFFWYQIFLS